MTFDKDKTYEKEDIASWPPGHRRCRECHEVLPFEQFHKHKQCLFGINTVCKTCRKPKSKAHYALTSQESRMWNSARGRAKKYGIPFDITVEDIVIPKLCPVFGVPLVPGTEYAPSLDQKYPRKGYTKDNIVVISNRANVIKNNASWDELHDLCVWMVEFYPLHSTEE